MKVVAKVAVALTVVSEVAGIESRVAAAVSREAVKVADHEHDAASLDGRVGELADLTSRSTSKSCGASAGFQSRHEGSMSSEMPGEAVRARCSDTFVAACGLCLARRGAGMDDANHAGVTRSGFHRFFIHGWVGGCVVRLGGLPSKYSFLALVWASTM